MWTTTLLLATLAVGIDTGYEPTADGGLEYIIQIPPDLLQNLEPGEVIKSELPEDLRGVRRYRIQVGTGRLPRIHAPESFIESSIPTAMKPIAEAVQTSAQSPIQPPDKQSPFEIGPTTSAATGKPTLNNSNNSINDRINNRATTFGNERYGSLTPTQNQYGSVDQAAPNFVQTQSPLQSAQQPLQLPPPPDGLDHLYNTAGANPAYPGQPNLGQYNNPQQNNGQFPGQPLQNVPQGYPNNQYINATGQPNYAQPTGQFPNNPYPNNAYPGGNFPNNQYPNNQQQPIGPFPNNNLANNNFPNQGYPNGVNNTGFPNNNQGNPQIPAGYQNGQNPSGNNPAQQTADNRNNGSFSSNSSNATKTTGVRIVKLDDEESPGDVSSKDRAKSAAAEEAAKPWLPMYVTGLAAVGSLLGNLYLAWMWLETRRRYRQSIIERTLVA